MRTLALVPSIIHSLIDSVDFFPLILSDVAYPQLAGLTVKTEAPRIAKSPGINLGARHCAHAVDAVGI